MSRLDDLDRMINELNDQEQKNEEMIRKAEEARKMAEENTNRVRENRRKAEEARAKYAEAEELYAEVEPTSKKKSSNIGNSTGARVTALVLAGSILTGSVVYALTRKSYAGKVQTMPVASPMVSDTMTPEEVNGAVTYDYEELTGEKLRNQITSFENYLRKFNLATSSEDIEKFVIVVNINKIATDHPEYISEYVDETNIDEFMQDAYQTLMDIITYNGNIYYTEKNADNFIMADEAVFDKYSKNMLVEIENCFKNIAVETDDEKFNEKVTKLLMLLMDPTEELSQLESGVGFASYTSIEPIRRLFSGRLNDENAQLIKYFVPYAGDEVETLENCRHNGYSLNVESILKNRNCENSKVLSK